MHKNEMRLDPLTDEWTLFSEARAHQPPAPSLLEEPRADPLANPFLAGMERYTPHTLHRAESPGEWTVRVVPNRSPVLRVEGDPVRRGDGFYDHMDGVGAHEVVIETDDLRPLEELDLRQMEQVVLAWKARILDLAHDKRLRAFMVIKSAGRAAGALVPHALSQVIALAVIPCRLKRKLEIARAFYAQKKRSIFEDILSEEVRTGLRVVYENHGFCAFCPYASRTPFEMVLYPKRQSPDFYAITDEEVVQLADALRVVLQKLNGALDHPPYQFALITAPMRTERQDQWGTLDRDFRWHLEVLPRLYPSGPLELATGSWVSGVWPEVAAESLRAVGVTS